MKKILILILITTLFLTACGGTEKSSVNPQKNPQNNSKEVEVDSAPLEVDPDSLEVDVDITEKMYVTYINEIYVNAEDYIGQTIRIQGMFQSYSEENNGPIYYYVYRTGPGCCGNDGSMCGFEFNWDNEIMPKDNDWIEVVGTLRLYEEDGFSYLILDAISVNILSERGAETVSQ